MRVTTLLLPLGVMAASMALFRGPPAEVRFRQEVIRGEADRVELEATQQWSRAAEATAFGNAALRASLSVILSCLAAKLEVVVTEKISCPNPHDQPNCARAKAAETKAGTVCGEQIGQYTSAAQALGQANARLGRELGAALEERARRELGPEADVVREDALADGEAIFSVDVTKQACRQAAEMAREGPMLTAPFPVEVDSRVPGFAKAVLAQVASRACGSGDPGPARLLELPGVADDAARDCRALAEQLRCQVMFAAGSAAGCDGEEADVPARAPTSGERRPRPLVLSSAVAPYASCRDTLRAPVCTFDMPKCVDAKIIERSEAFLAANLPPGPVVTPDLSGIAGPRHAAQRSCTTVSRPVSPITRRLFAGLRRFVSFGRAEDSDVLDEPLHSTSCGVWYFRDGPRGSHEGTALEQEPFLPSGYSGFALVKGP